MSNDVTFCWLHEVYVHARHVERWCAHLNRSCLYWHPSSLCSACCAALPSEQCFCSPQVIWSKQDTLCEGQKNDVMWESSS